LSLCVKGKSKRKLDSRNHPNIPDIKKVPQRDHVFTTKKGDSMP